MQLMLSPSPGISAFPDADGNLLSWTATITGPTETPYEGLVLKLSFAFPNNYPYAPPTVLYKTPIYHPNVDFSGRICLDILKDRWSAVYNVQSVLLSLQSLLGEPNKYDFSIFLFFCYGCPGYADFQFTARARLTPRLLSFGIRTKRNINVLFSPDIATSKMSNRYNLYMMT